MKKWLAVFVVTLLACCFWGIYHSYVEQEIENERGTLLFPELNAHLDNISRIYVQRVANSFTLVREGRDWRILELDFPADNKSVMNFLSRCATLRAGTAVPGYRTDSDVLLGIYSSLDQAKDEAPERVLRIDLISPGQTRTLFTGNLIAHTQEYGDRYVSLPPCGRYMKTDALREPSAVAEPFTFLESDMTPWLKKEIFTAEFITRIALRDLQGKTESVFFRSALNQPFVSARKGETVNSQMLEGYTHLWSRPQFVNVASDPDVFVPTHSMTLDTWDQIRYVITLFRAPDGRCAYGFSLERTKTPVTPLDLKYGDRHIVFPRSDSWYDEKIKTESAFSVYRFIIPQGPYDVLTDADHRLFVKPALK